jgi:dihydrodipicolinate synthase/N-acetylneuraminate lyase
VQSLADIWLMSLYVISFGSLFAFIFVHEHRRLAADRPRVFTPADETAMEALLMMRGLVHQLGNNAHELALQFDLALNTDDQQQQQQIRDNLRSSLHRFIAITHEVSQIDARLTGYQPPKDHTN